MIVYPDLIIILASEKIYCVEHVFKDVLKNFRDKLSNSDDSREENLFLKRKHSLVQFKPENDDLDDESKLNPMDIIFNKLLQATTTRLGQLVNGISKESSDLFFQAMNLGITERIEFMEKIHMTLYNLN